MHVFEQKNCVPLFSCAPEAGVTLADFWDAFHMRDEDARRRYSELLAQHLAVLLKSPDEDWSTVEAAMAPRSLGPATTQAGQPEDQETPPPATRTGGRKRHP